MSEAPEWLNDEGRSSSTNMSHQGTSSQVGTKLRRDEHIAQQSGESRNQVQRYIRLTYLVPEILNMVDAGKIALTPVVELSYLNEQEQRDLLETMESEDCTPSLPQAIQQEKSASGWRICGNTSPKPTALPGFRRGF